MLVRFFIFFVILIFIFVFALIGVNCAGNFVVNEVEGVVTAKERVCRGSGESLSCNYEVRTEALDGGPGEVFANRDSLIHWKFDSADVQNNLREGRAYRFTVTHWRIPFLSMFRNIIEYDSLDVPAARQ